MKLSLLGSMFLGVFAGTFILTSFTKADRLSKLTKPITGRSYRASSGYCDPESNRDSFHPQAGQRLVMADLEGPGEIRHLWFTTMSRNRRLPRALMLRIYYDGSKVPSVETPLGDFFAAGNGMKANVKTEPIEVSSYGRALNCYWKMPFRKSCRIEIHNQGPVGASVYFHCDWQKLDSLSENVMYFHARYRQEYPAKPFSTYTVFEGKGEGHYVGTVFSSQNNLRSWFGEADDRFYIDGEETPSIVGTGTEDYFNDAWNLRLTSGNRVGTTICEPKGEQRRVTSYRWHIDDPVTFKKSLKMIIERRSYMSATNPETGVLHHYDFKYRPDYWSSVAFWYQKGIAEKLWSIPPYEKRILPEIWVEPLKILDKIEAAPGLEPKRAGNRTCSRKEFFFVRNDKIGSWFTMPFKVEEKGRYAICMLVNLNKRHGIWKISLIDPDGQEILLKNAFDMWDNLNSLQENWPENAKYGTTVDAKLGTKHLMPGDYKFRFECVGANPMTQHPETGEFGKGFSIGFDAIGLRRLPIEYPYAWIQEYLKNEKELFQKRDKLAAETVRNLHDAIQKFKSDKGAYPLRLDELIKKGYWKGTKIPRDPWGQEYCYRAPGRVNPWGFDVYSVHGASQDPKLWFGNWNVPYKSGQGLGAIVLEGEDLANAVDAAKRFRVRAKHLESRGDSLVSGGSILYAQFQEPGDWADIQLPQNIPSGRYELSLAVPTSWNYGIGSWALGETVIDPALDMYSKTTGVTATRPMVVELTDDPKSRLLRIKITGKSEFSPGFHGGLDSITLKPVQ